MVGTVGLEDGADGKIDHGDSEGKIQKDAHSPVDGQVSDKEEVCEIRDSESMRPIRQLTNPLLIIQTHHVLNSVEKFNSLTRFLPNLSLPPTRR